MTATTNDRNTQSRNGRLRAYPAAAATLIPSGVIACLNATNLLVNGSTSNALVCVGVTTRRVDNAAGVAGQVKGEVERGVFGPFGNSAAGDQITLQDVGNDCYIVDNQTVAKTSGSNTRSVAGKVHDVTADGVYINFTK
jgi:hypothetical protein